MSKELSKTQIDRLGDRIKRGQITDEDSRLLDQYRRSFAGAYEAVVRIIRDRLELEPTGRRAKATSSIVAKLQREHIRLTQIQDIAGCRLVVANIAEQESVIQFLTGLFPKATIIDRRAKPSHGYRAVHVVVNYGDKLIEIQVRTSLQQLWAEMSEKFSDDIDRSIKYGGGDSRLQEFLQGATKLIVIAEEEEKEMADTLASLQSKQKSPEYVQSFVDVMWERQEQRRLEIYNFLKGLKIG
jgi:ppGpp synthetase/RelA/SpoT-type nucleotidyltranferase